jgi:CRISPR-associated protein Csm2
MEPINKLNYVDHAEKVIETLARDKKGNIKLTTSKIRNILAMISEIYNEVVHESGDKLTVKSQERIQYLRLRITYEAGREADVKDFIDNSELLILLKKIGESKSKFLLFCRYIEALVAYHRFSGGKDK